MSNLFVLVASPLSTYEWGHTFFYQVESPPFRPANVAESFLSELQVHTLDTELGPNLLCPSCKSTLDLQVGPNLFCQVHPRLQLGPEFFSPNCRSTLEMQMGPNHCCPSCKSNVDSQLGPNLFLSELQVHR